MGHAPARIDEKGRLKVPANFRKIIEERFGQDCFITSTDGERALIYPMSVGHAAAIDTQGRLLIPTVLRNVAGITDDVVVIGNQDHLVVWNEERIQKRLSEAPLTPEDFKELELHGV